MDEINKEEQEYGKAAKNITDYISENNLSYEDEKEDEELYSQFQAKFSPEKLKKIPKEDLLDYMFLHDSDKNNLCYALEYDEDYKRFGSIKGNRSPHYGLFKSKKTGKWTSKDNGELSDADLLKKATEIRDSLVDGAKKIEERIKSNNLNELSHYVKLDEELNRIFEKIDVKPSYIWIHKYYHMIFPGKFPIFHRYETKNKKNKKLVRKDILAKFKIKPSNEFYGNSGQIVLITKKSGISSLIFGKVVNDVFNNKTNIIDVKNDFIKWFSDIPSSYINFLGKTFENKWNRLNEIENKYYTSFKTKLFYIDISNISKQIELIQKNLGDKPEVDDKTFHEYNIDKNKGIPNAIINTHYIDFLKGLKIMESPGKSDLPVPDLPNQYLGTNSCADYAREKFLNEVVFVEKEYGELVELLRRKKNIILQGSPGVGKTFIAKQLSYSLISDKYKVEFIQFHQSYSYEDFIRGYRPTKEGFELKNGVFYNFCMKAIADPDNDYYFIIDEINRGNISKIFGEAMMLIEEDKRGEDFAIQLTYSDIEDSNINYNNESNDEISDNNDFNNEDLDKDNKNIDKFYVPDNLYIIGMMNTADRSLAIIDYALRRRFVFYTINPLFDKDDKNDNIFKKYLCNNGVNESLAIEIIRKFKDLNKFILDDEDLGDGFKIGHSYFCVDDVNNQYESIVKYEIAPLLREYWFDDLEKAEERIKYLIEDNE